MNYRRTACSKNKSSIFCGTEMKLRKQLVQPEGMLALNPLENS